MKQTIRIDAVRASGVERTGTMALPGRLEAAVRRALAALDSLPPKSADVATVRVRVDPAPGFGPDEIGAAVAIAIEKAQLDRGAERRGAER